MRVRDSLRPRCPCRGHRSQSHRSSYDLWQTGRRPSLAFCYHKHNTSSSQLTFGNCYFRATKLCQNYLEPNTNIVLQKAERQILLLSITDERRNKAQSRQRDTPQTGASPAYKSRKLNPIGHLGRAHLRSTE